MKRFIMITALLVSTLAYNETNAQPRVSVHFNIGSQPVWGPTGYDYAQYYYMPEMGVYYNVSDRIFIYPNNGGWVQASSLPPSYGRYDLYHSYKVVINESNPWLRNRTYRSRYSSYRNRHNQGFIRDSRDQRYWEIKDHPRHGSWRGNNGDRNDHNNNNNGHNNNNDHNNNNNPRDHNNDRRGTDHGRGH